MAIGNMIQLGFTAANKALEQARRQLANSSTQPGPTTRPADTFEPGSSSRQDSELELMLLRSKVASSGHQAINLQPLYDRIAELQKQLK